MDVLPSTVSVDVEATSEGVEVCVALLVLALVVPTVVVVELVLDSDVVSELSLEALSEVESTSVVLVELLDGNVESVGFVMLSD
ncbi:hypothetical protein GGI10_005479, partial [Coemansia sp. RSA 2530]